MLGRRKGFLYIECKHLVESIFLEMRGDVQKRTLRCELLREGVQFVSLSFTFAQTIPTTPVSVYALYLA